MLMGSVAEIKPPSEETVFLEDLPEDAAYVGMYNRFII